MRGAGRAGLGNACWYAWGPIGRQPSASSTDTCSHTTPLPASLPQLCYYQALEFAIERGLRRVEAGAQGGFCRMRLLASALTSAAAAGICRFYKVATAVVFAAARRRTQDTARLCALPHLQPALHDQPWLRRGGGTVNAAQTVLLCFAVACPIKRVVSLDVACCTHPPRSCP